MQLFAFTDSSESHTAKTIVMGVDKMTLACTWKNTVRYTKLMQVLTPILVCFSRRAYSSKDQIYLWNLHVTEEIGNRRYAENVISECSMKAPESQIEEMALWWHWKDEAASKRIRSYRHTVNVYPSLNHATNLLIKPKNKEETNRSKNCWHHIKLLGKYELFILTLQRIESNICIEEISWHKKLLYVISKFIDISDQKIPSEHDNIIVLPSALP